MAKKTVKDADLSGKRVLMRVDFNVPLKEGGITDDTRIRAALPTIEYILAQNDTKLILMSHLGRPKGKIVPELSLAPVAADLERKLTGKILMAPDCVGADVKRLAEGLSAGEVLLLENLRFHIGEQKNDDAFAKKLASLCDIYVNDAFAVAHRENASVVAITKYAPICAAGFLLQRELNYFAQALKDPARPLVAIIGGAKVSSKLGALENLLHPELFRLMKSLSKGKTSETIFIKGQAHVVRIADEKKTPPRPFEEVSESIRKSLIPLQLKKSATKATETVLKTANISYHPGKE